MDPFRNATYVAQGTFRYLGKDKHRIKCWILEEHVVVPDGTVLGADISTAHSSMFKIHITYKGSDKKQDCFSF